MSLPEFDLQGSLFESLASMAADLFEDSDRYKLLTTKIWPLLALEELARQLAVQERPQFWDLLWERYVENCSKLTEEKSGKVSYRFEFGSQCHDCRLKGACLPSTQPHRTITVGAHHESLQQRRRDQQSEEFQLQMHQRNAIEGTISELVRGHGLRRARYKGFAKVDLQNQLIAAACNIKRWFRKLLGTALALEQTCRFEGVFSGAF